MERKKEHIAEKQSKVMRAKDLTERERKQTQSRKNAPLRWQN